jgi:rhodanese-related sulfurtransferase
VEELKRLLDERSENITIIDVREPKIHLARIDGSGTLPLKDFPFRLKI